SGFRFSPTVAPASRDTTAGQSDGNAPAHQWQLHSSYRVGRRVELDGAIFHVGALRAAAIPSYTRADARVELKLARPLSIAVVGQNLFEAAHSEFADQSTGLTATRI